MQNVQLCGEPSRDQDVAPREQKIEHGVQRRLAQAREKRAARVRFEGAGRELFGMELDRRRPMNGPMVSSSLRQMSSRFTLEL